MTFIEKVRNGAKNVGGFLKDTWNNLTGKTANDIAAQGVEATKQGVESTYKANAENIASQERINSENVRLQERLNQQNIDWARELNNIEMARADSAHQRESADMRKAGLSPFASMNGSDVGALTAPTLTAPTLNAPLNDVGAIGSSIGNMASAIGNQAQVVQSSRAQTLDYALGMLNFVKGEQSLKHQKDYDNETVELAKGQLALQEKRDSVDATAKSIQNDYNNILANNALSQEERTKQLHALEMKKEALEIARKEIENQGMSMSNKRSSLAYQSEQKDFAYKDEMLETQLRQQKADLSYTIANTGVKNMEYVLQLKEKAQKDENLRLTKAEIEKIGEELKLDKKKWKLEVVQSVFEDLFGVGKIASDVLRTVSWIK